jgi:hypothetical protein
MSQYAVSPPYTLDHQSDAFCSRVLFWHTDSNLYSIVPNIQTGEEKFLQEEKHGNISDADRKLLHESFVHM